MRRWLALAGCLSCSAPEDRPPQPAPDSARAAEPAPMVEDISIGHTPSSASAATAPDEVEPAPPPPVPKAVLAYLEPRPYVEDRCEPAAEHGLLAKRCRYKTLGLDAEVVVANPDAEIVGRWAVDAAELIEPLEAFRSSDPASWERGVLALAKHVRHQSSRIFPLRGDIVEDLGDGPTAFAFDRGVVTPCSKGSCRCRINSLSPRAFCRYREKLGDDFASCVSTFDGPAGDEAWRARCLENHQAALKGAANEHFRAHAFVVGERVKKKCTRPKGCSPAEVVMVLEKELGLSR